MYIFINVFQIHLRERHCGATRTITHTKKRYSRNGHSLHQDTDGQAAAITQGHGIPNHGFHTAIVAQHRGQDHLSQVPNPNNALATPNWKLPAKSRLTGARCCQEAWEGLVLGGNVTFIWAPLCRGYALPGNCHTSVEDVWMIFRLERQDRNKKQPNNLQSKQKILHIPSGCGSALESHLHQRCLGLCAPPMETPVVKARKCHNFTTRLPILSLQFMQVV